MSLIQEALKRQQEDGQQEGAPAPEAPKAPAAASSPEAAPAPVKPSIRIAASSSAPAAAAPPPPPPEAEEEPPVVALPEPRPKKSSRTWFTLVMVLVLILLFLGGAVWMLTFVFQRLKTRGSLEGVGEQRITRLITEAAQSIPPPETVPPFDQSGSPPESLPDTDDETVEAPADEVALEETGTGDEPVPESVPESADMAGGPDEQAPAVAAVEWPLVSLEGMVGKGATGAAIINDTIVGVGESVDGVKLISIDRKGVYLEYGGEQRFLKVGGELQ